MHADIADLLGPIGPPKTQNALPAATGQSVQSLDEAGSLRAHYNDDLFDLLGSTSPLDRSLAISTFPNTTDTRPTPLQMTMRQVADMVVKPRRPLAVNASEAERKAAKSSLPMLKLATVGGRRSGEDISAIDGVEIDYDGKDCKPGERLTVSDAVAALSRANLAGLVYTTPTHSQDWPRWRVLLPTSKPLPPSARLALAERFNGLITARIDAASFALGTAFFYGALGDAPRPEVHLVEGRAIDEARELPRRPAASPVKVMAGDDDDDLIAMVRAEPLDLSDAQVGKILDGLPSEWLDDHDLWLRAGMALHHQYRGSTEAFERWCTWAKQSEKFDARDHKSRWKSFKGDANPTTMRTLIDASENDPGDIQGRPLNEDGVALAFRDRFQGKLRFCHSVGRWFAWTGTHWSREETGLAFDWARVTCRELVETHPKSVAAKALAKAAAASAVERFAKHDRAFAVTADAWDADPMLLGTPGGTVDLRTGTLRTAQPGEGITKLTSVAPIPLDRFNPARDCPRWIAFLDEALAADADAIRFFQQWAGYSLTGDTREEALLFVHGPGGSGKSTAINTLGDLMGAYAINVETETLTATKFARHSTEIARLKGARMARASETEQGRAWAENRIKALTGGDTVTARFMRQDDFEFRPEFKLTIVGNHRPAIESVDDALRRRFNVIPFDHRPARADHGLKAALEAEGPAILSWAMSGCLDWLANGLTTPRIVSDTTAAYFEEQDPAHRPREIAAT